MKTIKYTKKLTHESINLLICDHFKVHRDIFFRQLLRPHGSDTKLCREIVRLSSVGDYVIIGKSFKSWDLALQDAGIPPAAIDAERERLAIQEDCHEQ